MMHRRTGGVLVLGVVGVVAAVALAWQPHGGAADPDDSAQQFATMLMSGLKGTEGCLGAEAAKFQNGKYSIVAWFKDKASVQRWYNSPIHVMMMRGMGTDPQAYVPLEHVEDPNTPVMVMATMTLGEGEKLGMMPFNQISIEMYTPLPGGAMYNGRLAPEGFPIPDFKDVAAGAGEAEGQGEGK